MKSVLQSSAMIAVSSVLVTSMVACGSAPSRSDSSSVVSVASSDGATGASMRVDGLGCPMCAESISILMDKVEGVQDSRVDLSTGTVVVDLDPSVSVSSASLQRAIDDGGFTFRSIEFVK